MEQWRNLIHINRNFQKAVNLQLDIGDHGRIEHYIPTRSSMLILRRYLKAVTGEAKEHATVLIGPYGKGKSHLLLVLLSILSCDLPQSVFEKIKITDPETADLVTQIRKENKKIFTGIGFFCTGVFHESDFIIRTARGIREKWFVGYCTGDCIHRST